MGVPISVRLKNYWPFVTAAFFGTVVDFGYGYFSGCAEQKAAYNAAAKVAPPGHGSFLSICLAAAAAADHSPPITAR